MGNASLSVIIGEFFHKLLSLGFTIDVTNILAVLSVNIPNLLIEIVLFLLRRCFIDLSVQ